MKKSARYTALALVALTSALLLGACGGNKQATTTSSTTKTSQSSKMTKSSTKAKAKSENKTKASSSEEMKADSSASQETQPAKQAEPAKEEAKPATPAENQQPSSLDTDALLKGDFSSVAGSYQNDLGETITVSASGSVTLVKDGTSDTSSQLRNGRVQGDGYVATFAHNDGPGSDPIFFDSNGQIRFGSAVDYGAMHAFSKVG